ncbi:Tim44 domain-containing protein [Bradyrhizobium sp. 83012]|uniref:Tim44 domain-containing protein n=1 Tax=Bradyrhizobium aeschynomenes TaxID=2734909 RepID=A0ABX2CPN2_9BRAD|nr:Tim44 domain-containing protein [Bradyrhizobium aeschynomenes]NPU12582.1 Tim44 domain-containing protein [Bradyrhizobium aeschynomenes]NPU69339.1 Tim44 domain-containing protein [Bradyrhizobium aeschynomenes]NPV25474.1 Tim44 domain-containing protein [Bradyrhizobium aeschynomenes]
MQRKSGLLKAMAVALSLALPTVLAVSAADARIGGGSSSGSRGTRTFSAPPPTSTAPGSASQFNRTMTQPGQPGMNTAAPARGGLFGGRAGGLLGGLAAGFLGAGLFGMLFGGGLFSGLGGFASIIGLILQVLLVVLVVRFAMAWWQRRNQPAYAAGPTPSSTDGQQSFRSGLSGLGGGFGGFGGGSQPPLQIQPADYEAFERLLGDIQSAWSSEDVGRLRLLSTPEMASYFERDLEQNQARGVVNKVTGVKLLQGDLAESWRENGADYATVAMRFTLADKTIERASGRVVDGSDQPQEVTEIWTFLRHPGAEWQLSAIQQVG